MRALALSLAVLVLCCTHAHAFNIPIDGPVYDYLQSIVLDIPDQEFTFLRTTYYLTNMTCFNVGLEGIEGFIVFNSANAKRAVSGTEGVDEEEIFLENAANEMVDMAVAQLLTGTGPRDRSTLDAMLLSVVNDELLRKADETGLDMKLKVYGLTINCTADFRSENQRRPEENEQGNITLAIGGGSSVSERVLITAEDNEDGDSPAKVYAANSTNCTTVLSVTYANSTVPGIREKLPTVVDVIEDVLPRVLCARVDAFVSKNVTMALNDLAAGLVSLADKFREDAQPLISYPAIYASWSSAVVIWIILVCVSEYIRRRSRNREAELRSLGGSVSERARINSESTLVETKQTAIRLDDETPASVLPRGAALVHHSRLHYVVRYLIPLLLLINMALFITSNASVGASVVIYLTLNGTVHKLPSLFAFTLTNSVSDMWQAGVYPLSILIALFSGIWPYTKLFLMLLCWVIPPKWLSVKTRELTLKVVDALGKWSLIDSYVLVLMIVAFRISVGGSLFAFDLVVDVNFGFYSFLAATMMSLLLSHATVYFHRHAEDPAVPDSDHSEALCSHEFSITAHGGSKTSFTLFGKISVVVLLLTSFFLMCAGGYVNSFDFNLGGYAATLLDATEDAYSILSLTKKIPHTTFDTPNSFLIRWIQFTFLGFSLAIPLGHLFSLAFLWVVPMAPSWQHAYFVLVEILNAWSAVDVFVVSIIAALLEIEQFAEFIVGDKCDPINELLLRLFPDAGPDITCFSVKATLNNGCWILLAAVTVQLLVATVLMVLCSKAIEERFDKLRECPTKKVNYKQNSYGVYEAAEDVEVEEHEASEEQNACARAIASGFEWISVLLCSAVRCVHVEKARPLLREEEVFDN